MDASLVLGSSFKFKLVYNFILLLLFNRKLIFLFNSINLSNNQ